MSQRLTAVLLIAALAAAGCARKQAAPPEPPPPTAWPQGHTAPFKITDSLTIEVPLQYWRFAIDPVAPPRVPVLPHSDHVEVQFDFFLPDFSGYTLRNYRNESDENKVEVVYLHAGDRHEADPDAPGEYPPNMLKRALKDLVDPKDHQDLYGLRCYRSRILTDRLICYGRRDENRGEDILLYVPVPPYPPDVSFPMIQARYFSKRYGGVRIAWRTHVQNLPRWHEIDAQIWKFIDDWKMTEPPPAPPAGNPPPAAPTRAPAPPPAPAPQ